LRIKIKWRRKGRTVNNRRNWEQGIRQEKRMREVEEEEYHNEQNGGYEKEKTQNREGGEK
jgi:hypothetical protein